MKVAILGSCVTKQPFECKEGGVYVLPNPALFDARSSVVSLTTDPIEPVDRWLALCNEWEREWMLRDFQKSLWSRLPRDLDVLVMDLIDERHDLLQSGGRYKLESPEILQWRLGGNHVEEVGFSHVPRAEAEALWDDAVRLFFERLRATAPGVRVVVHRALCAIQADNDDIDVSTLRWTVLTNAMLERYYQTIARIAPEVTFVEAPPALRRQKRDHKYGQAPFHFIDEYDAAIAHAIRDVLDPATASREGGREPLGEVAGEQARIHGAGAPHAPASWSLDWTACPRTVAGIRVKQVPEGYIVYHPGDDRGHFLNPTAAVLLRFCEGRVVASDLPALLQAVYRLPEPPVDEVAQCLQQFFDEGLVR